ncbi:hypothetical protein AKG95_17530 [Janthinobacterium lividum]|jgi:hypothetical protein|uniref:Uncharacterized protein n=1 Tax=Janthinobacterium lividum TaxID=29581 RepID=A0A1S1U900_9BURK|nr:hypothetical protein [Janthinobacterium lividum]OHV96529.1 hypothetical protein AKG95_17530 [Janthinobacterium lividum]
MPKNRILSDHKRIGKRLVPPIMQLPNVVATSFRDEVLPDLIWLATLFRKLDDRTAVNLSIDFVKLCSSALPEKSPPLIKLGNFDELSTDSKDLILAKFKEWPGRKLLLSTLGYQAELFPDYPLAFLFDDEWKGGSASIAQLKDDVTVLLDRYAYPATKVQVTALVALATSGKLFFAKGVEIPDFDAIFTSPDSDAAKRAASFARANLNAGVGLEEGRSERWVSSFWHQSHYLEGCE